MDNIGFGDLVVTSDTGLAITGVSITDYKKREFPESVVFGNSLFCSLIPGFLPLKILHHLRNLFFPQHLTLLIPDCIYPCTDIQHSRPVSSHDTGSRIGICHDIL